MLYQKTSGNTGAHTMLAKQGLSPINSPSNQGLPEQFVHYDNGCLSLIKKLGTGQAERCRQK
jgi:hypothetical protein